MTEDETKQEPTKTELILRMNRSQLNNRWLETEQAEQAEQFCASGSTRTGTTPRGTPATRDTLLSAGIHIGTRIKTLDMEPFIYRVRPEWLIRPRRKESDDRIRVAAKFLARFEPAKVAVAAARLYAQEPIKKILRSHRCHTYYRQIHTGQLSKPAICKTHRTRSHSSYPIHVQTHKP